MGKNYQRTQQKIRNYIYDDYLHNRELTSGDEVIRNMSLLVENNLATKISGVESLSMIGTSLYKIASRFLCKYDKHLKNFKRKTIPGDFEEDYKVVGTDKRIIELNSFAIDNGTYYVNLGNKKHDDYALFKVSQNDDDKYMVKFELYFIGYRHLKFKDKFFKMYDEYKELSKSEKEDLLLYSDRRPSKTVRFKPFDQMVFKDKDKILKYIDNWVNNIPNYYKYGMTPKLSILLYGEPGTGKSTFSKALAKYLNIESCTIISPDYFNHVGDNRRSSLQSYIPTIYSIDDIDCCCESRKDNKSKENTNTLSTLLEFLDNPDTFYFKAKDGLYYPISIVVASTNYIDKLDSAVKRYGRFDLKIEMLSFNEEEAEEMCALYDLSLKDVYKEPIKKDFSISPSYLQALCLENIDNAFKAVD